MLNVAKDMGLGILNTNTPPDTLTYSHSDATLLLTHPLDTMYPLGLEAKERGNQAFRDGDFPTAIREYEECIKRDPTNAPYHNNLAAAELKMMLLNDAKRHVEKALELDKTYVKVGPLITMRKLIILTLSGSFFLYFPLFDVCVFLYCADCIIVLVALLLSLSLLLLLLLLSLLISLNNNRHGQRKAISNSS